MNFNHLIPTQIVFGRGRLKELGPRAAAIGRSALIVCGRSSARTSGLLKKVETALVSEGMAVEVFDDISPNPKSDEVDAAAAIASMNGCDVVIGLGGGSALDAAKAAAVSIDCDSVRELIGETVPTTAKVLPIIAIPTTAGTGSEVTKGAIIKDVVRGFRSGVRGDCVFPKLALIDPDVSQHMPRDVAVATAFDALTHAVESYVARAATPITDILAEKAIRLFAAHHGALLLGRLDAAGHDAMCFAALLGGINVANAGSCLPHRLQQATGAVDAVETSHPQGLAALYPSWLRCAYPFAKARFDRVGTLLGFRSKDFTGEMAELIEKLGLQTCLGRLGYRPSDVAEFMGAISGNLMNDPIDGVTHDVIESIYADALDRQFHARRSVRASSAARV
jgi:alcohol dehydrogenase class IV